MWLRLCTLGLLLTGACGHEEPRSRTAPPEPPAALLARERQRNDSLVLAALAWDGARLEYRWVVDEVLPGDSTARRVFEPGSRKWLTLNDTVVLNLARAKAVELSHNPGASYVSLHLDMAAGDRFLSTTTRHLHRRLAVLLNGQLLAAPGIGAPWGGDVLVTGGLDSAVAVELATRLRSRLPMARRIP